MKIIIKKTTEEAIKNFNEKEWKEANIEYFGKIFKWKDKLFVFKAMEKGKIVGSIRAKYTNGVVFIRNLIVAKDKRHQGIGKKMIEEVEKSGKKLGAHKFFLWTGKKWSTNKFYKKLGYKKTNELKRHYFKVDYVIYSKFIKDKSSKNKVTLR